jgi:hypothetical protein
MNDELIQFARSVGYEYANTWSTSPMKKEYTFVKNNKNITITCGHYDQYSMIILDDYRLCCDNDYISEMIKLILIYGEFDEGLISSMLSVDILKTADDCKIIGSNRQLDGISINNVFRNWYIWPSGE